MKYSSQKEQRSNNQKLSTKNLKLIVNSRNYQLAHEDKELLNSDEMRGVRMLFEISKPEKILEEQNILSKVINFKYLSDYGLISDEHLKLFRYADSASEEWEIFRE